MATTIAFGQESQHLEGANQSKSENDVIRIKEVREGLEMEVNVYPNPSNGLIYLEGLPGTTITIYSSQGVYVGTWVIDSGKHITTAELPQGSFLCVLSNGDKQVTKRVVVL
jgi:hypothetical protein